MKKRLSRREAQVVQRIAQGMSLREIAADLNIGYNGIRNYVRRAFAKTGRHSQAELAELAVFPPVPEEEWTLP